MGIQNESHDIDRLQTDYPMLILYDIFYPPPCKINAEWSYPSCRFKAEFQKAKNSRGKAVAQWVCRSYQRHLCMDSLRRRIPFTSSEEPLDEDRVLDEQEQEELIEKLQDENEKYNVKHFKFVQACLSFAIMSQCFFLLPFSRQATPIHMLLPNHRTPRPPLIPFASFWTLFHIFILLNLVWHLPKDMSFPRLLRFWSLRLPRQMTLNRHLPLSTTSSGLLLCVAPIISLLLAADIPQILWWSVPFLVFSLQTLVISWIKETEREMQDLQRLRYEAKGA